MVIRDNIEEDCPFQDFIEGIPNGKCWGDGHYMCQECINYRKDFKNNGQEFIDFVYNIPQFFILTLEDLINDNGRNRIHSSDKG